MTNAPSDLREMWTDVYKLFDIHYKMQNTTEAWTEYWNHCSDLYEKHKKYQKRLIEMLNAVSGLIKDRIDEEELDKQRQELAKRGKPCTLEDMDLF